MKSRELITYWDNVVASFLDGGPSAPERLQPWFDGYSGSGHGEVMTDALPEPWLGRLTSPIRTAFLQLNPGLAVSYQLRDGMFAEEIRDAGSYSDWTATWPYQRARDGVMDPLLVGSDESMPASQFWAQASRFGNVRLRFAQNWFDDDSLTLDDVVMFELYPWHSRRITAPLRVPVQFVRDYVWEALGDLSVPIVFAFGAPWFGLLRHFDVDVVAELRADDIGSAVKSRSIVLGRAKKTGTVVVAEKHAGGAGPPRASEVAVLRRAFERAFH